MPSVRDFLPPPPDEGPPVPEYLLKMFPFLRGSPFDIWKRFWPFPALPPELGGSRRWALEKAEEVYHLPLTKEEKYLRWSEIVTAAYSNGLLTEQEKDEYLSWEFAW